MNSDFPQNEREQLEAKFTALLLGELPADEAIEISKAMEQDAELKALYERLQTTIGFVHESAKAKHTESQANPLKLSSERREKLLAQFKTVTPKEFAKPTPKISPLLQLAAVLVLAGLLAALLLPSLAKSKSRSMSASVTANLRMLDGAKQQWALENSKSGDAVPTMEALKPYLGRGEGGLPSVAGEAYVPGKVSEPPMVETSPAEAKKLIGRRAVTTTAVDNGKVQFSLLPPLPPAQVAAQTSPASVPASPTSVQTPRTEIVLPSGALGQAQDVGALNDQTKVAMNRWAIDTHDKVGNLASDGSVQQVSAEGLQKSFTDNLFVSRNATIVPSPGQLLDQGSVTVMSGRSQTFDFGIDSTNATVLAALSSSTRSGYADASAAWNLGTGNANEPAYRFGGPVTVRGFYDDNLNSDSGAAKNEVSGKVTLLGDIPTLGAAFQGETSQRPDANGNPGVLMQGENHNTTIVLPAPLGAPTGHSTIVANGGSMPTRQFGGGGGVGGKQVEIAAASADSPQMLYFGDSNIGTNRGPGFDWYASNFSGTTSQQFGPAAGAPGTTTAASDQTSSYLAAKQQLETEKRWRQILAMRTGQEEVDKNLPKARMVSIPDPATVGASDHESLGQKIRETLSGKVERSARIEVEQEHPDIAGLGSQQMANYDPYFIQTESETIKSAAVLQKVVEDLKLDGGDKSKTKAAVEQLRKNIDVSSVKNTKYIEIRAANAKPEEAANIANSVARAYKEYRTDEYAELKTHGIDSLKQQLAEQDKKVQIAQAKVDELRKGLVIPDYVANASSETYLMSPQRLKELDNLRVQKEADYNQQKTLLEKLKPMDRSSLERALPITVSDSQLNTLTSELDLAQQDLIKLKTDYNPDHPKYKAAQELVDDLNRKVNEHMDGVMAGLQTKMDASKASLDQLNLEIEQADKKAEDSPESKIHIPIPLPTPQPETLTRENAFSTFSLNVSDVSFKLAAAGLEKGQMPEPGSIRSEEFINAFNYRDPDAGPGVPIAFASERARYPFAHNRELLRFSLKTAAAGRQAGRPLNIVLLLDNSGSMERADRVRIIQEALRVLAGQLQKADTFSIVTFARTAQLRVDGVHGDQAAAAAAEIAKLTPEGGTNLGEALDLAYETARHHYLANGDNRVVLLTDGAANLGDVKPDVLKQKVEAHRKQGIALDCFGIGWEDYNDDLLEVLTRNGDGRYGFLNKPEEASTEFVSQIAGALHVAAADVKVQVEFNPKRVTSYRQIGYAKHQLTKEQFRDNTVDAAEIAAQEAGNALYTIETNPQGEGSIATVRVRYNVPATGEYREQAWDVPYTGSAVAMEQASPAMRLATTASAFSEWLATSPFAAEVSTDQLLRYLNGVPKIYGADTRPAKLEWMIRQAKSISGK